MKQFYYQGKNNPPQKLILSKDLIIIRTKNSIHPSEVFVKACIDNHEKLLNEVDDYPEASVWVFQIMIENPETERKIIKQKVRKLSADHIEFIGSVLQRADNKTYQIYTGNLFLKFKDGVSEKEKEQFFKQYNLEKKLEMGFDSNSFFLEPKDDNRSKEIFERCIEYLDNDLIELCHPELVVKRKSFQPSLASVDPTIKADWASEMIELESAWKSSKGKNVKICIIDDGIDHRHLAFSDPEKIILAKDMFDEDNTFASHKFDTEIHGTACASIASSSDPKAPGIAPESKLMIIRSKGLGSVYESEAIVWAAKQGADIISCSWGPSDGNLFDESDDNRPEHPLPDHTRMAIEFAAKKGRNGYGCLIFFAAGNGNEPLRLDGYASNDNVMAIGAVNKEYRSSSYSDYGYPLFCCFPSSEILIDKNKEVVHTSYGLVAADRLGKPGYSETDYFYSFGGTSAACPGMAGVAALMLSIAPDITIKQARKILSSSCILPLDTDKTYNAYYGHGIINAALVVKKSKEFATHKRIDMNTSNKTYALHIGIDKIDQNIYKGAYGDLNGCVNDANDYINLTKSIATESVTLFNEQATREAFETNLISLAEKANSGDTVIITYAGHGGVVADTNGDEDDFQDETLVLYDGPWIDDETYEIWHQFDEGVNIIWISDSCHSGSNARALSLATSIPRISIEDNIPLSNKRMRGLPTQYIQNAFEERKADILPKLSNLTHRGQGIENIPIKAAILTFAACQDNQVAWEENGQGLFTSKFKSSWSEDGELTYEKLFKAIKSKMPGHQNPNQKTYGDGEKLLTTKIWLSKQEDEEPEQTEPIEDDAPSNESSDDQNPGLYALDDLIITTKGKRIEYAKGDGQRSSKGKSFLNVSGGIIRGTGNIPNAWDRAYDALKSIENIEDIDFIEPDIVSTINADPYEEEGQRGDSKFLDTYPNPESEGLDDPFIWHLGKDFSQLKDANRKACPEIRNDAPKPANEYPLIAHIDTGVLLDHPSLPKNWDDVLSRDHRNPEDKDRWFKKNGSMEQQGHGQGTIALLAGNIIDPSESDGSFGGYFGAFPYARVMSLRISDSVVILRAKKFAEAVDYAIKVGADVITMSMAGAPSKRMVDAVNRAYEAGVVVVSAGGNSWSKGIKRALPDTLMYPARFKRVIAATGATATHQPYLNKYNKGVKRAAGGRYMQSCYGPQEYMDYAIAAYTPNVAWGDGKKNATPFGRKGGGTSSATPQIAAAAALWIHHHREDIMKHINDDSELWKKAEFTRQALFRSAELKNPDFEKYFGNGILRADNALELTTDEILKKGQLSKQEPDSIGRLGIDDLIKMWFRGTRGSSDQPLNDDALDTYESKLKEMIAIEIEQLMVSKPELADFAYNKGINEGLAKALINLKDTSKFLKDLLKNVIDHQQSRGSNSLGATGVCSLELEDPTYRVISQSVSYEVKQHEVSKIEAKQGIEASFEINMDMVIPRGGAPTDTMMVIPHESGDAILVKTEFEDNTTLYEWKIPGWDEEIKSRSGQIKSVFTKPGEVVIYLNPQLKKGQEGSRGIFSKIKKFIVKIFRTIKDEPVSGMKGLVYTHVDDIQWKELDKNNLPNDIKNKQKLMLLHGTFSSTESSFNDLTANPDFLKIVKSKFGGYLFGFEMSTIRSGVKKNADDLARALKNLKLDKEDFAVIGHSRGCLVGRLAFTENQMVLSAGTHLGTPMATRDNIVTLLNRVTTILGLAHPGFKIVGRVAAYLAKKIWDNQGLLDQAIDSDTVKKLKKDFPLDEEKHLLIGSNFEPKARLGERLFDPAVDFAIFKGKDNDGVTLTSSALISNEPDLNRIEIDDKEISHFEYFSNQDVVDGVIKFLSSKK